eukprot:9497213-Pyramimonas_sp.AAC.3
MDTFGHSRQTPADPQMDTCAAETTPLVTLDTYFWSLLTLSVTLDGRPQPRGWTPVRRKPHLRSRSTDTFGHSQHFRSLSTDARSPADGHLRSGNHTFGHARWTTLVTLDTFGHSQRTFAAPRMDTCAAETTLSVTLDIYFWSLLTVSVTLDGRPQPRGWTPARRKPHLRSRSMDSFGHS